MCAASLLLLGVMACGGGGDGGAVAPPGATGAITLALAPTAAVITPGSGTTVVATVTRSGGFAGAVALSAEGAPAGVTVQTPTVAAGSSSATLEITTTAATPPGTYPITVRASGTGIATVSASLTLTIATPDFALSVPSTVTVQQGQVGSVVVSITRSGGFTGGVTLVAAPAPQDVQLATAPSPATGATATVTITPQLTSTPGTYPITVSGAADVVSGIRTAQFSLIIVAPPTAGALTLSPANVTVTQGSSATIAVSLARAPGVTGNATFALEDAPPGVTGSFTPNPASGSSATLTLNVGVNHPSGSVTFRVRATVGTSTVATPLALTTLVFVPPDFALTTTPPAVAVTAGNSTSATVAITRSSSFTGSVALTISGAPGGVSATATPASAAGASAALAISTTVAATPGVYLLTINGTADGIAGTRSTTVSLTVNAPASGGSVQWPFCRPGRVPLWMGTRTGTTGAWTRLTAGANNTYTVPFAQNGQVAYVHAGTNGFDITVLNLTPAEAVVQAAEECRANPPTHSVNGTVTGVSAPRGALVMMGGSGLALTQPPAVSTFALTGVAANRPVDLLAFRVFIDGGRVDGLENVILRRNLQPVDGASLPPLHFSGPEEVEGDAVNRFFDNFGSDPFTIATSFFTVNGYVGTYQVEPAAAVSPRGVFGIATAALRAGDLFQVVATTTHPITPRQLVVYSSTLFSPGARSFGPVLAEPAVTVVGSAPVRLRASSPWQAEYALSAGATFRQAASGPDARTVTMSGSREFFGAGGYSFEVPDFSGAPGWNPTWMLRSGVVTTHTVSAVGQLAGSSPTPANGVELRSAQHIGSRTP